MGPNNHQKIVIHETYHLLQFEQRWLGTASAGANWIVEGGAEYVGWRGLANRGVIAFEIARGCMVKEDADFDARQPPGLPNLNALETQQAFQTTAGPLYPHSMIGVDELLTTSGIGALNTYGTRLPEEHRGRPRSRRHSARRARRSTRSIRRTAPASPFRRRINAEDRS